MNDDRTITAAIEVNNVTPLFAIYKRFINDEQATYDDLFSFLTTPSPEREEFLSEHCLCYYTSSNNIVLTKYKAL